MGEASHPGPKCDLSILSWNIGGLDSHRASLLALIQHAQLDIICRQEAKVDAMHFGAFRAWLRSYGYTGAHPGGNDLLILWRRGLNLVPFRSDNPHVFQAAIQLSSARALLRTLHAPSGWSPLIKEKRLELMDDLACTPAIDNIIDIGDFNDVIESAGGLTAILPPHGTFRRHADPSVPWGDRAIDAARVSPSLGHATIECLGDFVSTQHCPIVLRMTKGAVVDDEFFWSKNVVTEDNWTLNLRNSFDDARLAHDTDRAWSIWNEASTTCDSSVRIASGTRRCWGSGSTGDTLSILLKRHRQALAEGTDVGDVRAHRLLATAEQLIFDDKLIRIKSWRDKMSSRKGAAQWIRSRLQPSL